MDKIKAEINRRFGKSDQDDLKARIDRCTAFDKKWLKERVSWTKRLDGLNTLFDHKLKQALNLIAGIQKMTEEVTTYELDENNYRT